MMPYSFIVVNVPLQYRRNNRIASCCNYRREHFQYRPTLVITYVCKYLSLLRMYVYIYMYRYNIRMLNLIRSTR